MFLLEDVILVTQQTTQENDKHHSVSELLRQAAGGLFETPKSLISLQSDTNILQFCQLEKRHSQSMPNFNLRWLPKNQEMNI